MKVHSIFFFGHNITIVVCSANQKLEFGTIHDSHCFFWEKVSMAATAKKLFCGNVHSHLCCVHTRIKTSRAHGYSACCKMRIVQFVLNLIMLFPLGILSFSTTAFTILQISLWLYLICLCCIKPLAWWLQKDTKTVKKQFLIEQRQTKVLNWYTAEKTRLISIVSNNPQIQEERINLKLFCL